MPPVRTITDMATAECATRLILGRSFGNSSLGPLELPVTDAAKAYEALGAEVACLDEVLNAQGRQPALNAWPHGWRIAVGTTAVRDRTARIRQRYSIRPVGWRSSCRKYAQSVPGRVHSGLSPCDGAYVACRHAACSGRDAARARRAPPPVSAALGRCGEGCLDRPYMV